MFKNKEYVLTVYEQGSFSKAAEKLFISQPSLSASIKRIEEKVTAKIFNRSATPLTLTDVGYEYVKVAKEIQAIERSFEKYVSDHTNLLAGKIKIGGTSFFASLVLPQLISAFNKKYPKIQFEVFEDSTKNLMHKLSAGEVDLIIDNAVINDENIISNVYKPETILLAVPKKFEINKTLSEYKMTAKDVKENKHLTSCSGVELKHFAKLPFILLNQENDTGKRAEKLFKKHFISPNVIFRLDQQVTAYNVSCTGMGLSFVSDTLVKNIAETEELYYYKITDRYCNRDIYIYSKKNHYLSLACRKFIEYSI